MGPAVAVQAVLGAYVALSTMTITGLPWWATFVIVMPVLAAVGWLIETLVLNRAIERGELAPIIATFGLSVIISSTIQEVYSGRQPLAPLGWLGCDGHLHRPGSLGRRTPPSSRPRWGSWLSSDCRSSSPAPASDARCEPSATIDLPRN